MRSISCFRLLPFHNDDLIDEFLTSVKIEDGFLKINYKVHGNIKSISIDPLDNKASFEDELWKRTVFEVFLQLDGEESYIEWNFSSSSSWACYEFDSYRKPEVPRKLINNPPKFINFNHDQNSINLSVEIPLDSKFTQADHFKIQLSSIILDSSEKHMSYYAIEHSSEKPDFHDLTKFKNFYCS